ncbi:MAG: hypothetical protein KDA68_07835, partial [Planctomycetaceae bacterium]|nr:hypothetical protein [Planctomycetaceae bacterium]
FSRRRGWSALSQAFHDRPSTNEVEGLSATKQQRGDIQVLIGTPFQVLGSLHGNTNSRKDRDIPVGRPVEDPRSYDRDRMGIGNSGLNSATLGPRYVFETVKDALLSRWRQQWHPLRRHAV